MGKWLQQETDDLRDRGELFAAEQIERLTGENLGMASALDSVGIELDQAIERADEAESDLAKEREKTAKLSNAVKKQGAYIKFGDVAEKDS